MTGAACIGGPISDWPRGESSTSDEQASPPRGGSSNDESESDSDNGDFDGEDHGAGDRDDDEEGKGPIRDGNGSEPPSGSRADAGTSTMDAGTPASGEGDDDDSGDGGITDGGDAGVSDGGDTGVSDAGVIDGGDAGVGDAGVIDGGADEVDADSPTPEDPDCTMTSDAQSADSCYGSYCRTPYDDFMSMAERGGACANARELELACDGEIARVVAECAQEEALSLGLGRSVASCARRVESLASVGRSCLDCYVDEIVCAVRNCLVSCLDGSSSLCSECRSEQCGDAFLSCSGLPEPRGASASSDLADVDGRLPRLF